MPETRTFPTETILDAIWADLLAAWPDDLTAPMTDRTRPNCPPNWGVILDTKQCMVEDYIDGNAARGNDDEYTLVLPADDTHWEIEFRICNDGGYNELLYTDCQPDEFRATRVKPVTKQVTVWEVY
jgi:hypothetical protein